MCGIAGIHAYLDVAPPVDRAELERINDRMAARGPDGNGLWLAADGRTGLAHQRLAIIDLSEAGAQPMHSACGRYTITLQRRDLQLPRAARGTGRARLRLPQRLRHRGAAAALCRLRRRHGAEAARHVRLRPLGCREAHAAAGARSAGHQAALLGRRRLDGALRLAGQGAAGRRPVSAAIPIRRASWASTCSAACPSPSPSGARSTRCRPARRSPSTPAGPQSPQRYYDVADALAERANARHGDGDRAPAAVGRRARFGAPSPGGRRAGGGVPVGRSRFGRAARHHGGPGCAIGVGRHAGLCRVQGPRRRRGAARRRGRPALRRAPHRAHGRPRRVRARPAGASSMPWTCRPSTASTPGSSPRPRTRRASRWR